MRVTLDRFTLKDYIKNFIFIYMYILSFNNNNKYIWDIINLFFLQVELITNDIRIYNN